MHNLNKNAVNADKSNHDLTKYCICMYIFIYNTAKPNYTSYRCFHYSLYTTMSYLSIIYTIVVFGSFFIAFLINPSLVVITDSSLES